MTRISFAGFCLTAGTCTVLYAASACGGDLGLPPATVVNRVDTVTMFALRGTSIASPSGYDMVDLALVRTDQGEIFDIAFDIDSLGAALIYPADALGISAGAGVQKRDQTFDELRRAPRDDYVVDSALVVTRGTVFAARSRSSSLFCSFLGALPRFGKFHVLDVNQSERTITLELLIDVNCGYLNLEPGIPTS